MKHSSTLTHSLDTSPSVTRYFQTAVSLHCHTHHSKENLGFIPYYAERIPVVATLFRREMENYARKKGRTIDFSTAYWTPPVSPNRVLELERNQIEFRLDLKALVSLTDHDDIEAGRLLRALGSCQDIPISVEWTVPFNQGMFHLGVHNLPADKASKIMSELSGYTTHPQESRLAELFEMLNFLPDALVVLNHPLWDIERAGRDLHMTLLADFIERYGRWIHALEVNGYRSGEENRATLQMAEELGYPVVSGGDRHGYSPNAVLNLTRATTFAEFAAEVREDKISEILLMPEYRENLHARTLEAVADVIRHYPNFSEGQRYWTDRVFFQLENETHPVSHYWKNGGPAWVRYVLWGLIKLGSPSLRPALRLALARGEGAVL